MRKGRDMRFSNKLNLQRSLEKAAVLNAHHVSQDNAAFSRPTVPKLGMLYLAKECQALGVLDELIDEYEKSLGNRMLTTTRTDWRSEVIPLKKGGS